jgi:hypothetical protein
MSSAEYCHPTGLAIIISPTSALAETVNGPVPLIVPLLVVPSSQVMVAE